MADFRFAIVGPGNIAHKFADAVRRTAGAVVVAVVSRSQARAERFAAEEGILHAYDDVEKMIAELKPDCVYIAAVTSAHASLSELCLRHDTPVLCEKAMFTCQEDAVRVLSLAKERGVFAMEAMWSRFLPAMVEAKRRVQTGTIGEVMSIRTTIGFAPAYDPASRYFDPALGGGAAYDLSVYGYELTTWLMDSGVTSIEADVGSSPSGVDTVELVNLRLDIGVPVQILTTLMAPLCEEMRIQGTHGMIIVPKPHMAEGFIRFDEKGDAAERWQDTVTQNGFVYEVAEVLHCIRSGLIESPTMPHRDTIDCTRMYDEIHRAMTRIPG